MLPNLRSILVQAYRCILIGCSLQLFILILSATRVGVTVSGLATEIISIWLSANILGSLFWIKERKIDFFSIAALIGMMGFDAVFLVKKYFEGDNHLYVPHIVMIVHILTLIDIVSERKKSVGSGSID